MLAFVEPERDPQGGTQHSDLALTAGQADRHAASAAEHENPFVRGKHRLQILHVLTIGDYHKKSLQLRVDGLGSRETVPSLNPKL